MDKRSHTSLIFPGLAAMLGIIALLGLGSQLPQPPQHNVTVVNIEVPVRVFDGDRFVDNLTMADFEVFENGVLQKVEAAYLIQKTTVLRNATIDNGPPSFIPIIQPDEKVKNRHFLLIFEMDEYLPQLGKALEYFCSNVLAPNDSLRIITPENLWEIKRGPLTEDSRAKMAEDIKSKLRKSLTLSGSELRGLIMNLRISSQSMSDGSDPEFTGFIGGRDIIERIVSLKSMNVRQYAQFAKFIKPLDGQKYVFIFYQKESFVIPSSFKKMFGEIASTRQEVVDNNEIKNLFADADTTVHFLFVTKTKTTTNDVEYKDSGDAASVEMSGEFYKAFRNLADATGGISEATANPIYGFKRALDATENFYLVYYKPANYKVDGKYKEIEVKVKSGQYRVNHRAGYIDK